MAQQETESPQHTLWQSPRLDVQIAPQLLTQISVQLDGLTATTRKTY